MSTVTAQNLDNDFYGALKSRADEIRDRYLKLTPRSRALTERASAVFPGGFTRDAIMRGPYSPFVKSAQGTQMTDADGRNLTDFWFNASSLVHGHAHPQVTEAIAAQLPHGTAYFAPSEHELKLAELLVTRIPCADRVRFTNSGTEAVMMALRFARGFRQRQLVLKFEGSYHGSYDDVSWSVSPSLQAAGDPAAPSLAPESAGLVDPEGRTVVLPFNDIEALRAFVEKRHDDLACIIIEPLANRMGLVLPETEFLREARALCDRHGIVLIFDEVIAFRIGYHGAQHEMGVTPDLVTLGKIIGGGFPVGAVAGKAEILDLSVPGSKNRVTHSGTFNGNPITALAGLRSMEMLTPEEFARINDMGRYARGRLQAVCDGLPLQVTGQGSLFKISAVDHRIRNYRDAVQADGTWEEMVSLELLNQGFLMTPKLTGCISTVTTRGEIDDLVAAVQNIVGS